MEASARDAGERAPREGPIRSCRTAGWDVLLGLLGVSLYGAYFGLQIAWLLLALGAAVLVLSYVLSRRAVRAVEFVGAPERLRPTAGRLLAIPVTLAFGDARGPWTVAVVDPRSRDEDHEGASRVALPSAPRGSRGKVWVLGRWPERSRRASVVLEVTSAYPFGLLESRRLVALPADVRIGPRPAPGLGAELERWTAAVGRGLGAELVEARRGLARDLPHGLVEARGDETARDIAWLVSARVGRRIALVRDAIPRPEAVAVVLVTRVLGGGRDQAGPFEGAVSVALALVARLRAAGLEVRFGISAQDPTESFAAHVAAASPRALSERALLDRLVDVRPGDEDGGRARAARRVPSAAHTIVVQPTTRVELAHRVRARTGAPLRGDVVALVSSRTRVRLTEAEAPAPAAEVAP